MISEQEFKNLITPLIAAEKTHPKGLYPIAIWKVVETDLFRRYYNTFDGWFVWVQYYDGLFEIWFVVDVRGGLSDDDWYLEKIT